MLTIRHHGFLLRFNPTAASARLWVYPDESGEEQAFLESYLRPSDVYVDIGANIGELVINASKIVGAAGKVIAAEAHPKIYAFLQRNLRLNNAINVAAYNVALGNLEGSLHFSNKRSDEQNCVLTDGQGISVPVTTLDSLVPKSPRINLLKIDVEGYEPFVLQGAGETLRRTECVYFEVSRQSLERFNRSFKDVWTPLNNAGLNTYLIVEDSEIRPVGAEHTPGDWDNFVSVRSVAEFVERTGYSTRASV